MTNPTTNMGLLKGTDSDNAESYLASSLATSLDKIDVHTHAGGTAGLQVPVGGLAAGAATGSALGSDVMTLTGTQAASNKSFTNQTIFSMAGFHLKLVDTTGGDPTPNKYLQTTSDGKFALVNSAQTTQLLAVDDSGNATLAGTLAVNGASASLPATTFRAAASGDAMVPVRMLSMPYLDLNPTGSFTVDSTTAVTILTGTLNVNSPGNGLVLVVARVAIGGISNPSGMGLSVLGFVDSTEIGRVDHTPSLASTDTFTFVAMAQVANGAHTIALKAFWNGTSGSPSGANINDSRWTQGYAVQLA